MKFEYQLSILCALVVLMGGFFLFIEPSIKRPDSRIDVLPETHEDTVKELALPAGRKVFVDPNGRFSFQYEDDGNDYTVELINNTATSSSEIFSVCDALNCYFVGVEVGPLRITENDRPEYNYTRLTYDRESPDSVKQIVWDGYPAYKAVFAWQDYPERDLFIHIPHDDRLFTLYRSTKDTELVLRQFRVISETFRLLK